MELKSIKNGLNEFPLKIKHELSVCLLHSTPDGEKMIEKTLLNDADGLIESKANKKKDLIVSLVQAKSV